MQCIEHFRQDTITKHSKSFPYEASSKAVINQLSVPPAVPRPPGVPGGHDRHGADQEDHERGDHLPAGIQVAGGAAGSHGHSLQGLASIGAGGGGRREKILLSPLHIYRYIISSHIISI